MLRAQVRDNRVESRALALGYGGTSADWELGQIRGLKC